MLGLQPLRRILKTNLIINPQAMCVGGGREAENGFIGMREMRKEVLNDRKMEEREGKERKGKFIKVREDHVKLKNEVNKKKIRR